MKQMIPAIDGMRAIFAISLVAFHVRLPGAMGAYLGVDAFFVLSGFLTASILVRREGNFGLPDAYAFIIRRCARIWPLLAVVMIVTVAVLVASGVPLPSHEMLPAILFFSNFTVALGEGPHWLIHTWTLAAEIQFYALIALFFWVANRFSARVFPILLGAGFLAVTATRSLLVVAGYDWGIVFYMPFSHSSGLFLGALMAATRWQLTGSPERMSVLCLLMLGTAFVGLSFGDPVGFAVGVIVVEVATVLLIAAILAPGPNRIAGVLGHPVLARLGLWSYGIYLWHYPIARVVRTAFPSLVAFGITLLFSTVLAAITYRLVEQVFYARLGTRTSRSNDSVENAAPSMSG